MTTLCWQQGLYWGHWEHWGHWRYRGHWGYWEHWEAPGAEAAAGPVTMATAGPLPAAPRRGAQRAHWPEVQALPLIGRHARPPAHLSLARPLRLSQSAPSEPGPGSGARPFLDETGGAANGGRVRGGANSHLAEGRCPDWPGPAGRGEPALSAAGGGAHLGGAGPHLARGAQSGGGGGHGGSGAAGLPSAPAPPPPAAVRGGR